MQPDDQNPFAELGNPINLLYNGGIPPTPRGVSLPDKSSGNYSFVPNIGGHNRKVGGRVNTDVPMKNTTSTQSNILNRTFSIQSKK